MVIARDPDWLDAPGGPADEALRVLVLTDIVDSTRENGRVGDAAMAAVWREHDERARDLIRQWRGLEIGRSDGFLLLFHAAADALAFTLAYHRLLPTLQRPLAARAGLHLGLVSLRRNAPVHTERGATVFEVDGLAVPIAARIMAAAQAGQTLLCAAAAQALGAAQAGLRSLGHWRLKGVAEPLELFAAGQPGAALQPPPDSEKAYQVLRQGDLWLPRRELPHSLPAERDAFVGRTDALAQLVRRIDQGARLVTLVGPGGIGKTRLALRFGRAWLGQFPGGAWFCDLSPAQGLDGIVHAVAQGLGLSLTAGDPVEQLARALAGRGPCLLILDNVEQVRSDAAACLGRWLDAAGQATFVATSRERLGLPGEALLELPPLSADDSTRLFMLRAEAALFGFAPGAGDQGAIEPLVQLLDGLPLALELAAARVRVMSPQVLLQRMTERFRLLATTGARPDRQSTLRGAFDWSWALLSEAEKAALAQLSVFERGFSLEVAEALLDPEWCGDAWPLDLLQALVDKSLVRRQAGGRFDLLRTLQEYAAEHLCTPGRFVGSGEAGRRATQLRHARWFATRSEAQALAGGCVDTDNLVAACRRAAELGDAAAATGALVLAWAALRLVGPFRAAIELAEQVQQMPGLDRAGWATVGWVAGSALYQLGRVAEARQRYQQALVQAEDAGILRAQARLHCALGELTTATGEADQADEHLQRALLLARAEGDALLECRVLNGAGALAGQRSRLDEAAARYHEALAIARRLDDRRWEGGILGNLGWVSYSQGQVEPAQGHYEQALALAVETGDRRWEGNARCNLGLLLQERGRPAEAGAQLSQALDIARQIGAARLEATVLCNLGLLAEAEGDLPRACQLHEQAVAVMHSLGDRRTEGRFRIELGRLYGAAARWDAARDCLAAAQALLEAVSDTAGRELLEACRAKVAAQQALGNVSRC